MHNHIDPITHRLMVLTPPLEASLIAYLPQKINVPFSAYLSYLPPKWTKISARSACNNVPIDLTRYGQKTHGLILIS